MAKDEDFYGASPPPTVREIPLDDVKRSPSGRVPQWVLDEARGIPTQPVPWRGSTTSLIDAPRAGRSGRRWSRSGMLLLLLSSVVALGSYWSLYGSRDRIARPAAQAQHVASAPPVTRNGPPPGFEEAGQRLGTAAPLQVGSPQFRYSARQDDDVTPVTWSPCRPIHYVVRPDHQPPGGAALPEAGFAQVSRATGLVFVNDGATTEGPTERRKPYQPDRYGQRWAPVLVTWATADEVPDFGIDIIGEAGPIPAYTREHSLAYVSGVVMFDAQKFGGVLSQPGLEWYASKVILHELGHLIGLAHVNDPGRVMAPGNRRRLDAFQAGDLSGLASLGSGPCQPGI